MKRFIKRVLKEQKELGAKCVKLERFVLNEDNLKQLSVKEQKLMWQQLGFMEAYYKILTSRITVYNNMYPDDKII